MSVWRHLRAILLLPGMAAVAVPALIAATTDIEIGWGLEGAAAVLPVALGVALIAAGLAIWAWTLRLFARAGEGTLAPWDATRHLVVEGPYRHVRNPMITAVLVVLLGEAALLGSLGILLWAGVFFAINTVYFPLSEEPGLERRFGDEYREYKRDVPRWIPRRTPWRPG